LAKRGDLHAGIDSTAFSLVPLLGWAERHERAQIDDPGEPS